MLDALSKAFFKSLAHSNGLARLASRYGMRHPTSFARRFIAGETLDEALETARTLAARNTRLTLDQLGESVATLAEAEAATRIYLDMVKRIVEAGVERNVSLKLTQLGLTIDRASCTDNLRKILEAIKGQDFFVRIDMEDSPVVQATIDTHETLWTYGYQNVGLVLQSALFRSEADLTRLNRMGVRVRLVKGAYKEPSSVAYQRKSDVDAAFVRMAKALLTDGVYPAIGTHDEVIINETKAFAAARGIGKEAFEFQMLFGIRRDLQASLVADGYRVRVYVPFGTHWFPYFMRRLGERPANIGFVLRGIFGEK
jgi:proline dehydrogenase